MVAASQASDIAHQAQELIDRKRSKAALKLLEPRLEDGSSDRCQRTRLYLLAGIARFRLADFAGAKAQFQQASLLDARNCYASYYLGLCEERQGHRAEALLAYRLAMAQEPGFAEARYKANTLSQQLLGEAPRARLKPARIPGRRLWRLVQAILFLIALGLFGLMASTILPQFLQRL